MDESGSNKSNKKSNKKLLLLVHIVETSKGLHAYHERKIETKDDSMAFWVNRLSGMQWRFSNIFNIF